MTKIMLQIERTDKKPRPFIFKGDTANDLLEKLEIRPEEVIIMKNDQIILPDETIKTDDSIKLLTVASGG